MPVQSFFQHFFELFCMLKSCVFNVYAYIHAITRITVIVIFQNLIIQFFGFGKTFSHYPLRSLSFFLMEVIK